MTPYQFEEISSLLSRIATALENANAMTLAGNQMAAGMFDSLKGVLPEIDNE